MTIFQQQKNPRAGAKFLIDVFAQYAAHLSVSQNQTKAEIHRKTS